MNDTLTASPDPFASSLAGRKLGRYEVLARLASGGMAGVYVARALGVAGFERLFAIKVLHPHLAHEEEFISMFLDEARLAARIRHPNVVPTIDISDTPDAGFYLVMEYIEGDHLGALLQKAWKLGRRLPFPVTLRIVVDALEGLAAAHNLTDEAGRRLQLVHRDVSPHNIMCSTDGVARITDFGVAKAEVRLSTTREGQFKGKLAYMAPEHASNGDADQRSDLFSMAIILWESLAGRRLFRAENHAATLNKICLEPIPLLSTVDPTLTPFDPLLAKALERDPNDRFQSAEEFAEAIEEAAPLLGGLAKPREVAQLVREFAAEKVAHDAALIRDAIAQLATIGGATEAPAPYGHSQPVVELALQPVPAYAGSGGSLQPSAADAEDVGYDELELLEEYSEQPSRRWLWAGVLVAVAAAVGASAALLSRHNQDDRPPTMQSAPSNTTDTPANSATSTSRGQSPTAAPPSTATTPAANPNGQNAQPAEPKPSASDSAHGRDARRSRAENDPPAPDEPSNTAEPVPAPTAPPPAAAAQPAPQPAMPTAPTTPPPPMRRRYREQPEAPARPSDDELLPNPYTR